MSVCQGGGGEKGRQIDYFSYDRPRLATNLLGWDGRGMREGSWGSSYEGWQMDRRMDSFRWVLGRIGEEGICARKGGEARRGKVDKWENLLAKVLQAQKQI